MCPPSPTSAFLNFAKKYGSPGWAECSSLPWAA